jgi:hypothetical protein
MRLLTFNFVQHMQTTHSSIQNKVVTQCHSQSISLSTGYESPLFKNMYFERMKVLPMKLQKIYPRNQVVLCSLILCAILEKLLSEGVQATRVFFSSPYKLTFDDLICNPLGCL